MKRSHAPVFWLLFGAGGMLSALLGPLLVIVTGIAAPLGWPLHGEDPLAYPHALALVQGAAAKGSLFILISLFAWHAMHRILHSLHDVGIPMSRKSRIACYGLALAVTILAGTSLFALPAA